MERASPAGEYVNVTTLAPALNGVHFVGTNATVVSHEHFEFASHAAAPVSAEHVDQSPASPHVD